MNDVPHELNWVKEISQCSVLEIFSSLFQGATKDAEEASKTRRESFPGYPIPPFVARSNESGTTFAVFEQGNTAAIVQFSRGKDRIVISAYGDQYVVQPTLNNEGKCKLRINDEKEELEEWQVRRRVLEKLFFSSGSGMQTGSDVAAMLRTAAKTLERADEANHAAPHR